MSSSKAVFLVRYGEAGRAFELRDHHCALPGPDEVKIQAEFSGLNFADVLARLGLYPEAPKPPAILGYEVVGRIEALGRNVTALQVGQRVLAFTRFGGYASHTLAQATGVVPIPEDLDGSQACALATQYVTGYYAAEELVKLHSGDQVLVQAAAGGVGLALVQLAKRRGCTVYGTAGSDEKTSFLSSIGVDHPINYNTHDFEKEVLRLGGGKRLDVVFDALGGVAAKKGFRLLGAGGRFVTYGVASMAGKKKNLLRSLSTVAAFGPIFPLQLLMKSKSVIGVNLLAISDHKPEVIGRCMRECVELVRRGEIRPHSGRIFPVAEVGLAHEFLGNRGSIGKVAIAW